jgi:nucleoside 2-deoxyribosyltransferase
MNERPVCPVCEASSIEEYPKTGDGRELDCRRCGHFKIVGTADAMLPSRLNRHKLSGWIREQVNLGDVPLITTYNMDELLNRKEPPFADRVDRLLMRIVDKIGVWGGTVIDANDPELAAIVYGRDGRDVAFALDLLRRRGFLRSQDRGLTTELAPEGILRVEELREKNPASRQGFVAMWFDAEVRNAYAQAFEPAMRDAGYLCVRMDMHDHAGDINDEMIVQIKRSRFVVADLTGHRGGVYFEAGYAMGLGIPFILTCRTDHTEDIHFDLRQFNFIEWSDLAELKQRLTLRIQRVAGQGPVSTT